LMGIWEIYNYHMGALAVHHLTSMDMVRNFNYTLSFITLVGAFVLCILIL
jgi:hypothetical protein